MKFIKHEFKTYGNYRLEKGELVADDVKETMYFAMDNASQLVFEEEYGKGVIQALQQHQTENELMDPKFIRALAVATFKDINSLADYRKNAMTFKESPFYMSCPGDMEFVTKLITMVSEALFGTVEQQAEMQKKNKNVKNKKGKPGKK